MNRVKRLEDTLTYKTVPYLVEVEDRDMFIHGKSGEVRGVNMRGAPTGMKSGGRAWKVCKCRVAKIRPDYPYSIKEEWPENVDQHFKVVDPFEVPTKGLIFYGTREADEEPREPKEMAEEVIDKLKTAYENREEVETL